MRASPERRPKVLHRKQKAFRRQDSVSKPGRYRADVARPRFLLSQRPRQLTARRTCPQHHPNHAIPAKSPASPAIVRPGRWLPKPRPAIALPGMQKLHRQLDPTPAASPRCAHCHWQSEDSHLRSLPAQALSARALPGQALPAQPQPAGYFVQRWVRAARVGVQPKQQPQTHHTVALRALVRRAPRVAPAKQCGLR